VAVVGPSGSGKSTLLGLLAGLDLPTSGRVLVDGRDLATMPPGQLAAFRGQRMGFIFQSYRLLPTLTAEENVRVPLELAGDRDARGKAREWLARVGLERRAAHLPSRLSGGEQQRVALARAMAPQPTLLFADEPTGNLDSRTGTLMADLLFALVQETASTLVLVSHDAQLAERCGRVLELSDGRLVGDRSGTERMRRRASELVIAEAERRTRQLRDDSSSGMVRAAALEQTGSDDVPADQRSDTRLLPITDVDRRDRGGAP
jgi:putative ABC transport system ATP-binding protein